MKLLIVSTKSRLEGYKEFAQTLEALNVETTCVSNVEYCSLFDTRVLDAVPVPKLLGLVKRVDPDFLLTDTPYYVPHMAKLANQRVLLHMRGDGWSESLWDGALHPSLLVRMYTRYLQTMHTASVKKVDVIFPSCRWLQKRVEEHLPNHPTRVLYTSIDPKKWRPNHDRDQSIHVKHPAAVGVFPFNIYPKVLGLLRFIRAINKIPGVNFYFAGSGPYLNLVRTQCPQNMFLLGRLRRSEVRALLSCCDVFVHPSGLDAIPRSIMEASLMEKPIIASNVGGIPEVVKHDQTGYLAGVNDVGQWVAKIRHVLDNPDVGRKLGKNARDYVAQTFNPGRIARTLLRNLSKIDRVW